MRTKECEVQYNLARYEQQRKIAENEATRSRTLSAQVSTFSQTETELRSQLNIYVEKFKQASLPFYFPPIQEPNLHTMNLFGAFSLPKSSLTNFLISFSLSLNSSF